MKRNAYIPRLVAESLRRALRFSPVVVLTGPRQVGKSTLLRNEPPVKDWPYLTLDDPEVRTLVERAPEELLSYLQGFREPGRKGGLSRSYGVSPGRALRSAGGASCASPGDEASGEGRSGGGQISRNGSSSGPNSTISIRGWPVPWPDTRIRRRSPGSFWAHSLRPWFS
ncbi:AAA family ATPase [Thermosulfurimonas sp. F29]|uniref:AAA family ATPase n=1 Tax=Thermosulfurimonas sp. F29 TaxID=2867247 RepID=UPI002104CFCD|nr:AAA family ATPase [Thermosulfurimonas sp. F29]